MNKFSKIATLIALAVASSLSSAATEQLGTGPGSYKFAGVNDGSYYVVLDPGSYNFDSEVIGNASLQLKNVWLSYGTDNNPYGKNDIDTFTKVNSQQFIENYTLTLSQSSTVYLNVDALKGRNPARDNFMGSLTVSAVPEPASVALLLAGLGMIGFVGRRRRNQE